MCVYHLYFHRHFKSSTPALNVIIIIGSIVMYLSVVPLVLSFTGNTVAVTEEEREILLPVSCEVGIALYIRTLLILYLPPIS